jgi:hypothetical protein
MMISSANEIVINVTLVSLRCPDCLLSDQEALSYSVSPFDVCKYLPHLRV